VATYSAGQRPTRRLEVLIALFAGVAGATLSAVVALYGEAFAWGERNGVVLNLDLSFSSFKSQASGWQFVVATGLLAACIPASMFVVIKSRRAVAFAASAFTGVTLFVLAAVLGPSAAVTVGAMTEVQRLLFFTASTPVLPMYAALCGLLAVVPTIQSNTVSS